MTLVKSKDLFLRVPEKMFRDAVYAELAAFDTRIGAIDGAGELTLDMLEDASGAGMFIVTNSSNVPTYVQMTGDASINSAGAISLSNNSVEQANLGDDAVGVAELKIVERNITIAGGEASGTVTNAADIDGIILGVIPYDACENAIKDVTFTTDTGAIVVELTAAQSADADATVTAVVLQA